MTKLPDIKPCPFCGQEASIEESTQGSSVGDGVVFSVGCSTEDCIGYQSMTTFARRIEAVNAWNRRK